MHLHAKKKGIINSNALYQKFSLHFVMKITKKSTQAMANEDVVCTFYIPSDMQRLKCTWFPKILHFHK